MDDIVTWLRSILHNDRSVELHCQQAANEIERLREERDEAREFVQEFVNYADRFASRPRAAVTYNDLVDFIQSNLDDANKFLKKNTDG